jgi:hypothetical protein
MKAAAMRVTVQLTLSIFTGDRFLHPHTVNELDKMFD